MKQEIRDEIEHEFPKCDELIAQRANEIMAITDSTAQFD